MSKGKIVEAVMRSINEGTDDCWRLRLPLGKWVHVGRVNDPARFEHFENLGVDSVDGQGISQYTHMREAIAKRDAQEKLPV